jgi:acetoin utilization protein AcuB
MKHPVHTVKPRDSIAHAREILERHRINQLPVVVNGAVIGIVTDRDLRDAFPSVFDSPGFAGVSHKPAREPEKILVEEVMSAKVFMVGPDEPLAEAARVMRRERIGAIPIVERDKLVGIVTRADILEAFVALEEREVPTSGAGQGKPEKSDKSDRPDRPEKPDRAK